MSTKEQKLLEGVLSGYL